MSEEKKLTETEINEPWPVEIGWDIRGKRESILRRYGETSREFRRRALGAANAAVEAFREAT